MLVARWRSCSAILALRAPIEQVCNPADGRERYVRRRHQEQSTGLVGLEGRIGVRKPAGRACMCDPRESRNDRGRNRHRRCPEPQIFHHYNHSTDENYIRYTSPNRTGQTAQTKYQYSAQSSIPWALRALYLPFIANHTTHASQATPAVTCAPWHPIRI